MNKTLKRTLKASAALCALPLTAALLMSAASQFGVLTPLPSITALRAMPTILAPAFPNVVVTSYYAGGAAGCPIPYQWNSADSHADNGGGVIKLNDTGGASGRFDLSAPSPTHSCYFGVKIDSSPAGTGTDNLTQAQAWLDWTGSTGPNVAYLDSAQGFCMRVSAHLTPAQGEIIKGDGQGDTNATVGTGSCINYTGIPGGAGEWVLQLQTPFPGLGTTPFQSPKFENLSIYYFSTDTNPGGCIQLNSIAGGFTDAVDSQQPLIGPEIKNVYCSLRNLNNSAKIGIQISKARDGVLDGDTVFGGLNGFDLEGVENTRIQGCAVTATFGSEIVLRRRGTFGNNTTIQNCQLLSLGDWGQTVDSILYDDARSSLVENTLFENFSATITLTSQIHLVGGFVAGLYDNVMTGGGTNWLLVDGTYNNITAYGNGGYGVGFAQAKFLAGNYWYPSGLRSILAHSGNGTSGDEGWPFNSLNGLDTILPSGVYGVWSANVSGLANTGWGASEVPVNSIFTFPNTGSSGSNYLESLINVLPAPIGTFNLRIQAAQTTGTGQLTCQITDNGALVGASVAQNITVNMTWYYLAFAQAVTTNGGWRCWNTGTGTALNPALLKQVQIGTFASL